MENTINTFTDPRDGQVYKTVKIGNQVWFAENLRYIPHVCPPKERGGIWVYNYHGNDVKAAMILDEFKNYGCMYNWETAIKIIPKGWHLPIKDEFETLINSFGSNDYEAYKRLHINGSSGFNSTFVGWRDKFDEFGYIENYVNYWSATEATDNYGQNFYAWTLYLNGRIKSISIPMEEKTFGFSIRCIKDSPRKWYHCLRLKKH
jgi:uncharacterized protein (TIGR02145 family)